MSLFVKFGATIGIILRERNRDMAPNLLAVGAEQGAFKSTVSTPAAKVKQHLQQVGVVYNPVSVQVFGQARTAPTKRKQHR